MDRAFLIGAIGAAAIGVYPIIFYPVLVRAMSRVRPRRWLSGAPTYDVAHVITVHNEEHRIRQKLENALSVRYPNGRADIVVASDGSTDGTEAIVAEFAIRGVRWVGCARQSKEHAQLAAIRQTIAPIIIFSDASTMLQPQSVEALLRPFEDPSVGGTSGADVIGGEELGVGEDLYIRYEMALRRAESLADSLVGLSGCFFAVRREVAEELKDDVPSDMGAALVCLSLGQRAIHAEDALCTYAVTSEIEREFRRKRRTALRGLRALIAYPKALVGRNLVASWELASHKILRFLSPVFFGIAVVLLFAAAASGNRTAIWLSIVLAPFMAMVAASIFWVPLRRFAVPRALSFFVLSNVAVAAALFDLLIGRKAVRWTPTRRT